MRYNLTLALALVLGSVVGMWILETHVAPPVTATRTIYWGASGEPVDRVEIRYGGQMGWRSVPVKWACKGVMTAEIPTSVSQVSVRLCNQHGCGNEATILVPQQ